MNYNYIRKTHFARVGVRVCVCAIVMWKPRTFGCIAAMGEGIRGKREGSYMSIAYSVGYIPWSPERIQNRLFPIGMREVVTAK